MDDHISALQCTHCSYLTRNLNVLFSHCMVAHPGEPVEVRLYQCPFCEMKCSVVNFLEEHIETVHATGYNVTVNEVIRFIFNSGHHFIHRSHFNNLANNVTTHPAAISANQSLPGSTLSQNWSTYSSNNYSQHQLACTNNTKRENWKVPEMNPNFVDLQSVRQSSNSKSKRVKANNTWFPAPPPLSLNQQASQEHPQQQQSQPPPLQLHHQLLLTPAPTTQLNQNSNSGVMPTLTGSGPTPINSTLSDTVAALMTPRQPRLATLSTPLQQLMLSSQQSLVHAGDLHHSNANIATTSQNQSGQLTAAHYTSRMANLAQRIMIQEEANSNPQTLQEKLQSILRKQAPLILRPQTDTNQGMFSQTSAGSNGPSSSSEIDKLLSQETSTRQLVSPTSGSTKSSQEDVLKSSQTSNGSTSSAGLTITESPDDQSNTVNITENTDTEGGKASDKVVRIQCNKCPESFDNAKALFCHRHFHHEVIVTKGRKHSQHNCYSQNRLINTDRRRFSSGSNSNSNSNARKITDTLSKDEEDLTNENMEKEVNTEIDSSNKELAIDLTVNYENNVDDTSMMSMDSLPDCHSNDVHMNTINHYSPNDTPPAISTISNELVDANESNAQQESLNENDDKFCTTCSIKFPDNVSLMDHYRRSRRHKTYEHYSVRGRRRKFSENVDKVVQKSTPLNFESVTRLRLAPSPKSLRLRNKDNTKNQTTTASSSSDTNNCTVHSCPHCHTSMSSPCQLLCHCWQMHKVRPLRCGYCHQYFVSSKENPETSKTQLSNHLLTIHGALHNDDQQLQIHSAAIRPSQCYYCNRVFANKPATKLHMKEMHPEYSQSRKRTRFSEEIVSSHEKISME